MTAAAPPSPDQLQAQEHMSLCEALDRLLHKGVVLRGEVRISVADIDLAYLSLQLLLASMDTAHRFFEPAPLAPADPKPVLPARRPVVALGMGAAAAGRATLAETEPGDPGVAP